MNVATEVGAVSATASGDRLEVERLFASARDALTDDIVGRVSGTVAGGLDLLDRINRSGIAHALPTIARMVENGDLERLVGVVRLIAAIEDSLSDDIVGRVATVATELAALVDKLSRSPGFLRLIDVLGREDVQCGLIDLAEAACAAKKDVAALPAPGGGMFAFLRMAGDPGVSAALRYLSRVSAHMHGKGHPPS